MLKNLSQLKCLIDNKEYVLMCEIDSSLVAVKEALFQFQNFIGNLEKEVKAKADQEAANIASEQESSITLPTQDDNVNK